MKFLIINGPNLNMVGIREPSIYGKRDFAALQDYIRSECAAAGVECELYQSNHEGDIVDRIQQAYFESLPDSGKTSGRTTRIDGIVINPGAYTHTSVAILDALKAVSIPTMEVHLSAIDQRESFRQFSYVSLYALKTIAGKGFDGYGEAIRELVMYIQNKETANL